MRTAAESTNRLALVSLAVAARELCVTAETVRNWTKSVKDFPRPVRINGRLFFRRAELLSWLDSRPRGGGDE